MLDMPGIDRSAQDIVMNTPFLCLPFAALLLANAGQAATTEASPSPAPGTPIGVDCADRALPSQREVGQMLGQHNLGQVHASRARLMAEVARACQREGVAKVLLIPAKSADGQAVDRSVASQRSR